MTSTIDYLGPVIGALLFVFGMSLVAEPRRQLINAFLVAGACGVYISGGFGIWENSVRGDGNAYCLPWYA